MRVLSPKVIHMPDLDQVAVPAQDYQSQSDNNVACCGRVL